MLSATFQRAKPRCPVSCGHNFRLTGIFPAQQTARRAARGATVRVAATAPFARDAVYNTGSDVKILNTTIRSCKSLRALEANYSANSSEFDEVCVATTWVTLARLPGDKEARSAFARHKLLGKTLATLHLMQLRALANVLWAIGKLGVDLATEEKGPYLVALVEERAEELVGAKGLKDGRHAAQLWYGLVLSGYPWSQRLRQVMAKYTVPLFRTWELREQGQVLRYMAQLGLELTEEQRGQLSADVNEVVRKMSWGQEQTYRSAALVIQGVRNLGLVIAPEHVKALADITLSTPPDIQTEIGFKSLVYSLMRLIQLQCPISPTDASRWEAFLLAASRAEVKPEVDKLADMCVLLSVMRTLPAFQPSEELKQLVVVMATSLDGVEKRNAIAAAEAWGVALLPEATQQRPPQQAAAGRKDAAARGRGPRKSR